MQPDEQQLSASSASSTSNSNGGTLAGLRNHPQFDDLRRLVQSNPAMLQRVLTQIGQQQPELLTEINANQEAFLQMMNEPIAEASASSSESSPNSGSASQSSSSSDAGAEIQGIPPGMMEGMANPAQMAQLIQNMSPSELNQMASMMGLSPEQLRLTEEEMAAVNRLADMGFDRTEAAQAYLACDKNEALAANLLMDSMGDGGFGGGFGGGSSGDAGNNNGNDGDDMYD